jgi:hypothetical protein
MNPSQRVRILKIAAAASVGLLIANAVVLEPALKRWRAQSERISVLRRDVQQGRQLVAREGSIRERWRAMQRTDLPSDVAGAENEVFKAVGRWGRDGRITFTALNPQWRSYDEGYATLECRASGTGDQAGIARFLYEMETDALPIRLESCEISANDKEGRRLSVSLRFTAVRLMPSETADP